MDLSFVDRILKWMEDAVKAARANERYQMALTWLATVLGTEG